MADWTDQIVGDRMVVDDQFNDRVQQSEFTFQEWGLIMTATEFEIENPGSEDARIVADTENLPQIMPELEKVRSQMGGMAGGAPGGGPGGDGGGGLLDSVKEAIGLGDDGTDEERLRAARDLTDEYARRLQRHLETEGKWDQVRSTARAGD